MTRRKTLRALVGAIPPGDALVITLPKFGKRDAYLALNAAAHHEIGKGRYTLRSPLGERTCTLHRLAPPA